MHRLSVVIIAALLGIAGCAAPAEAPSAVVQPVTLLAATQASTRTAVVTQTPVPTAKSAITPTIAATPFISATVVRISDADLGPAAVSFVDDLHGWVAYGTRIMATDDGGKHWQKRYQAPSAVQDLDFASITRGWAIINNNVFETSDGGVTWKLTHNALLSAANHIDFHDENHGWVQSGEHTLFWTDDGGTSWQQANSPCRRAMGLIRAVNGQALWALCHTGSGTGFQGKTIFKTIDAGKHWVIVAKAEFGKEGTNGFDGFGYTTGFAVFDKSHAWFSTTYDIYNALYATKDGGKTWQLLENMYVRIFSDLRFISSMHGFSMLKVRGTPQVIVETRNGGKTWQQIYPEIRPAEIPLFFDATHGIAVGSVIDPGAVLSTSDGGRTWQQIAIVDLDPDTILLTNPEKLIFSDAQHGCIMERRYHTNSFVDIQHRTSDGGKTWITEPADARCSRSQTNNPPNWRASDEILFFSANGTSNWIRYNIGLRVLDMLFVDRLHGWVQTVDYHLYATTDGGRTWEQVY